MITMRRTVRSSVEKIHGAFSFVFAWGSGLYPFTAVLFLNERMEGRIGWIVLL